MKYGLQTKLLLFLIASIYSGVWIYLATPYRLFPSDDSYFAEMAGHGLNAILTLKTFQPVFYGWLIFGGTAISYLTRDMNSLVVVLSVLAGSMTVWLVGSMTYRITRAKWAATIAAILYATAAWPVTYYFMASYAPLAALLFCAFLYQLIVSQDCYRRDAIGRANLSLALGGLLSVLFLWTSSSAPLGVAVALFCFLPFALNRRQLLLKKIAAFFVPFFLVNAFFVWRYGAHLLDHLHENIHTPHYQAAVEKFGSIPRSPFLSFISIGKVHAPLFFSFFILVTVFFLYTVWRRYRRQGVLTPGAALILWLQSIIWLHTPLLDLLPFTKLGRTHFILFPLTIVAIIGMSYEIARLWQTNNKFLLRRKTAGMAFAGALLVAVVLNSIGLCVDRVNHRMFTPDFYQKHLSSVDLYLLQEDPHSPFIKSYLDAFAPQIISARLFDSLARNKEREKRIALVVGPTGKNSALMSTLYFDFKKDLYLHEVYYRIPMLHNRHAILLPYYATYAPFMMEEEIMQALYLQKRAPKNETAGQNLKLFLF
ncbi:hypothetical protein JW992_09545 [candidate division KSB1 bacterium]|nr:hypothetical protein [candidate division KSB1 bacterium]